MEKWTKMKKKGTKMKKKEQKWKKANENTEEKGGADIVAVVA